MLSAHHPLSAPRPSQQCRAGGSVQCLVQVSQQHSVETHTAWVQLLAMLLKVKCPIIRGVNEGLQGSKVPGEGSYSGLLKVATTNFTKKRNLVRHYAITKL